jgi:hypothetical protein
MQTWRKLTQRFRPEAHQPDPFAGSLGIEAPGPIAGEEEFDLIALQSTPEAMFKEKFDAIEFELNNLSVRYTSEEIKAVKELRQRQLEVISRPLTHPAGQYLKIWSVYTV